jgi:FkbM family methyltransferase
MAIVSYAQNFEDVMLARAFPGADGFYVDVGANDPDIDSVTRVFYERGWRGINVEPVAKNAARLRARRPLDVNLEIAVGDREGSITFYEIGKWHGYSTTDAGIAAQHHADGLKVIEHTVPLRPLTSVLDEYAEGRVVDFLSIDVEGAELAVLRGLDLGRHRPKIIVAEARLPVTINMVDRFYEVPDRTDDYAAYLQPFGYRLVYRDGLNAFFLADEHQALARHFAFPPGIADRFVHAASIRPYEEKIAKLRARLKGSRPSKKKPARKNAKAPRRKARKQ